MSVASDLLLGVSMGLNYNPLVSVLAAPVVAVLAERSPKRHSLLGLPGVLLVLAWLIGDGWRVLAVASGSRSSGHEASTFLVLGLWAAVALAVGYVLPVWAGAFVGRRVTRGTGWAAAAAIGLTSALALVAGLAVVTR